jgi:hypothetical protein
MDSVALIDLPVPVSGTVFFGVEDAGPYTILYWDAQANNSLGAWVNLGGSIEANEINASSLKTGTFVLAAK